MRIHLHIDRALAARLSEPREKLFLLLEPERQPVAEPPREPPSPDAPPPVEVPRG